MEKKGREGRRIGKVWQEHKCEGGDRRDGDNER